MAPEGAPQTLDDVCDTVILGDSRVVLRTLPDACVRLQRHVRMFVAHDKLAKRPRKSIICPRCGGMIAVSRRARSVAAG